MDVWRDTKDGLIALVIVCVGILFAVVMQVMYDRGILIDEFVTGSETITLIDIQAAIIIMFFIFAAIYVALKR